MFHGNGVIGAMLAIGLVPAHAASWKGWVFAASTKAPIVGALVSTGSGKTAKSDSSGFYQLSTESTVGHLESPATGWDPIRQQVFLRIEDARPVRVDVFDPSGKLVATPLDGSVQPGVWTWSPSDAGLRAGVYFLRSRRGSVVSSSNLLVGFRGSPGTGLAQGRTQAVSGDSLDFVATGYASSRIWADASTSILDTMWLEAPPISATYAAKDVVAVAPDSKDSLSWTDTTVVLNRLLDAGPGQILVLGGRAIKVRSTATSAGSTSIRYTMPAFGDVFDSLKIAQSVPLDMSQGSVQLAAGVSIGGGPSVAGRFAGRAAGSSAPQVISFVDKTVAGFPGVKFSGSITIQHPSIAFSQQYGGIGTEANFLVLDFKMGETIDVTWVAGEDSVAFEGKIPLATIQLPLPVSGGLVTAKLAIALDVGAIGKSKLSASTHQAVNFQQTLKVSLVPYKVVASSLEEIAFDATEPLLEGSMRAHDFLNVDVSVTALQYELAGIRNHGGLQLDADGWSTLGEYDLEAALYPVAKGTAFARVPKMILDGSLFSWARWSTLGSSSLEMAEVTKDLYEYGRADALPLEWRLTNRPVLKELLVEGVALTPSFDTSLSSYTTDSVASSAQTVAVTAIPVSKNATVTCNGSTCAAVPLSGAKTPVSIQVRVGDRARTTEVAVLRKSVPELDSATKLYGRLFWNLEDSISTATYPLQRFVYGNSSSLKRISSTIQEGITPVSGENSPVCVNELVPERSSPYTAFVGFGIVRSSVDLAGGTTLNAWVAASASGVYRLNMASNRYPQANTDVGAVHGWEFSLVAGVPKHISLALLSASPPAWIRRDPSLVAGMPPVTDVLRDVHGFGLERIAAWKDSVTVVPPSAGWMQLDEIRIQGVEALTPQWTTP